MDILQRQVGEIVNQENMLNISFCKFINICTACGISVCNLLVLHMYSIILYTCFVFLPVKKLKEECIEWDLNPRVRIHCNLSATP